MSKNSSLLDEYRFPGIYPKAKVRGEFGDPQARIIDLRRRQKKLSVGRVEPFTEASTIRRYGEFGTCRVGMRGFTWSFRYGGLIARSAGR